MRITKDLFSGLICCTLGLGAVIVALGYDFGTLNRMGSGFFPVCIGVLVFALGVIMTAGAILRPDPNAVIDAIQVRPIFFVAAATRSSQYWALL